MRARRIRELSARVTLTVLLLIIVGLLPVSSAASAQQSGADSLAGRELAVRGLRAYYEARRASFAGATGNWAAAGDPIRAPMRAVGAQLNTTLDSAALLAPRDSSIAASRVWHRVVLGHYADADRIAATACAAAVWSDWLCSAFRGFTQFNLGRFDAAEEHFDSALRGMPDAQRCLWTDPSYVLNDRELTTVMRGLPCGARGEMDEYIWWLADPLWSNPGNERRSAHLARWTEAALADIDLRLLGWRELNSRTMNPQLETFLRMGMFELFPGFELGCTDAGRLDCIVFDTHALERFMPWAASVRGPFGTSVFDYSLSPRQGGMPAGTEGAEVAVPLFTGRHASTINFRADQRVRYQPYGEVLQASHGLMHTIRDAQVGTLLRSSGPVVLAAFDPRHASLYLAADIWPHRAEPAERDQWGHIPYYLPALQLSPMTASASVSGGPGGSIAVSSPVRAFAGDLARVSVPYEASVDSALVSLEAFTTRDEEYPVSARHRFAIFRPDLGVTGRLKSSDVLLYSPPTSGVQPPNAEAVLQRMFARSSVYSLEPIGVYWEVYGLREGEEPEFELSVARVGGVGVLRSLGRALGLASSSATRQVRWTAPPIRASEIGEHGETVFTLPFDISSLDAGSYIVQMSTKVGDEAPVVVAKSIRINKR